MNVIWHDTPREQIVSLAVKMQQGILRNSRDVWLAQPTFAMSGVQILFRTTTNDRGGFAFRLVCQFRLPSFHDRCRKRISQAKIQRLDHSRMIPMRQITPRIPAPMRLWRFDGRHNAGSRFGRQWHIRHQRRQSLRWRIHGLVNSPAAGKLQVWKPGSAGILPASFKFSTSFTKLHPPAGCRRSRVMPPPTPVQLPASAGTRCGVSSALWNFTLTILLTPCSCIVTP